MGVLVMLAVALRSEIRRSLAWAQAFLEPRVDPASPPGDLDRGDLETVTALAEVLGGDLELAPDVRESLARHLMLRARDVPGYLRLYRKAAGFLNDVTNGRFASLPVPARARVVAERVLPAGDAPARGYRLLFQRSQLSLETLVVPDLVRAYYETPAGWASVGYAFYPGRCGADLMRYTRPE